MTIPMPVAAATTSASPYLRYGPTVVHTTRVRETIASREAGESASATRTGQSVAAPPMRSRNATSLASERPASAILVPAGACVAR